MVISLLIGVAVSWLGVRKIDRELVTLATVEMKKFAMANSALSQQPAAVRSVLDLSASQAIREHFIVGEFQDRDRRKLATAINPLHAAMTAEVERQAAGFPLDRETHFRKFSADGQSWLRVRVRLGEIDEITLDIGGTVIEQLDVVANTAPEPEDDEDDSASAGPIAIAVDMNEAEPAGAAATDPVQA